jgi:ribose-phosphate pyrophosphokinase
MKILNLVNKDTSEIKYEVSHFPDGQKNVRIDKNIRLTRYNDRQKIDELVSLDIIGGNVKEVKIKSRLNNFEDLGLIYCATKSLRNLGVKDINLYVPYFLGSRSDRQFEEGSNNYLKDVICPIINSLNFESVTVLDPHSHVLEACLNNFKKQDNEVLVRYVLEDIYETMDKENFVLVSPDAGASHKIYKLAEQIGYKGDIITCSKERDKEGKLTKCVVPLKAQDLTKDFIIIDDICDGGATFINIAKELKRYYTTNKIYLIVTHGIFSKGLSELSKYFNGIYCTNSYSDLDFSDLKVGEKQLVKQLNVF